MLVLSRKLGERIIIGDGIVLTVVKIDRNQVRLGVEAPSTVPIFRSELVGRGQRDGQQQKEEPQPPPQQQQQPTKPIRRKRKR